MREIKFRAKMVKTGGWIYFTLRTLGKGILDVSFIWNTVGQSTGLKDKNGVEIYEGDITIDDAGQKYQIKWYKGQLSAIGINSLSGWPRHFRDIQFMEVIGNIYKNPELLKK